MNHRLAAEINEVGFPDELLPALKDASNLFVQSIERDGPPVESGQFDLGSVDEPAGTALFFLKWISSTNAIIQNLNIVIADMRALPNLFPVLPGQPHHRFYLLVATYFHEFYRFRESFGRTVMIAADRGYVEKKEAKLMRQEFHDVFGPTIALRNSLVHDSPIWTGKRHFDLQFLGGARELGHELRNKETGEIWEMRDVLKEICEHTANAFRDEGNRMSFIQKGLVEIFASLAQRNSG